MRVALFAAGDVGLEIATFFRESNEPLACVVVDTKGNAALNDEIIQNAGVASEMVYRSDGLNDPHYQTELKALSLDIILLAWWPYILKDEIIQIPRIGCLNFHPSYLPYNRGKHYNFWTIVEDSPFGVTLHFVDKGVDSGDIAFQTRIHKTWEDTGETLYQKAQSEIVKLFKENFSAIKAGEIPRVPQDPSRGSFHHSSELDAASQIDLDKSYPARTLLNLLRARTFPPHPAAWFLDGDDKYEVRVSIRRVKQ
jgi:methionyl-tRNA formyltransferase